ncbi:MAG: substrate-binding domain-containing protein [Pseudomonadota bacterium]
MTILCLSLLLCLSSKSLAKPVLLQSTTSTANSGLYDYLLPIFEHQTGIAVRVVAVGTGQALRNAARCDGDVVIVHAREAEDAFVAQGYGLMRHDLMYNDFVLIGPTSDPAMLRHLTDIRAALQQIAQTRARFVSRSDDSGTHSKEMSLWADAGIDPAPASGTWYLETGAGMGATINTGLGLEAYVLSDRATWVSFGNKADFEILLEGDPDLFNQYGIIPVDPAHCPNVNQEDAATFVDWMISSPGQAAIAAYLYDGQQLYFPNAAVDP